MNLLVHITINTIAVFVVSRILPGITLDSFSTAIVVAVVLGIVNVFIKPILVILTLPLNLLTLGLFTIVINGVMVMVVDYLVVGFSVENLLWAILFSICISIVSSFLSNFVD